MLERTRQIGIENFGASRKTIFMKFTAEAVLMSFFGGLLGLVVSYFAWNYMLEAVKHYSHPFTCRITSIAILMTLLLQLWQAGFWNVSSLAINAS